MKPSKDMKFILLLILFVILGNYFLKGEATKVGASKPCPCAHP